MPVREPVIVPTRDPVMVPVLDPVIVPAREPVMVPVREALDPVMVPADAVEAITTVNNAANAVDFRDFIFFSPGELFVCWELAGSELLLIEGAAPSSQGFKVSIRQCLFQATCHDYSSRGRRG